MFNRRKLQTKRIAQHINAIHRVKLGEHLLNIQRAEFKCSQMLSDARTFY